MAAFYLLPILAAGRLVISTPGAPPALPAALLIGGLLVGLLGLVYPTRRLVAVALCLYWLGALLVFVQRVEDLIIVALGIVISAGFLVLVNRVEKGRQRELNTGMRDAATAEFLSAPLVAINKQIPTTVPGVSGTKTISNLEAGEVTRHFDSQLEASVNGMLLEHMTYRGMGAGVGLGRFSFGLNRGTGEGTASVNLGVQGTIREDMTNESFTAVLERIGPDGQDVVRLIVPSAGAVREYVRNLLWDWQRSLRVNSRSELAVRIQFDGLADRLICDASYVADRLGAIARLDPSKRPAIAVVGRTVNEHSLLAGGIQFGPDGHWYQLFPIALINAIADLMNGRTPPPTPPTPPVLESPAIDSTAEPASAATSIAADGQLTASAELQPVVSSLPRLSVATIGQFSLSVGDDDVTNDLQQKPVASFLWLYTLARVLRNPKDAPSRPALADEVFPNLDSKQQRTRLRQRLSDMQSSLPPAISRCLISDGERVRFDLTACTVDVLRLRECATTIAAAKSAIDQKQLRNLEELADSIGDGTFLPEWEALEVKVTAGQGSASAVVETVREDVDRCRVAILVAVAQAHTARNQPALAVPYLERVNRSHPDNEPAAKALVAAYLETGQTARANQLEQERSRRR
ncbi:MAG: bacterial transcriptional activator domain-containing protein [Candidatus Dormibacteraeota bacterium]|nr:bacterial transcriptional activator domain-containing protein [Candidatus Dormibacteraeota bacterium]